MFDWHPPQPGPTFTPQKVPLDSLKPFASKSPPKIGIDTNLQEVLQEAGQRVIELVIVVHSMIRRLDHLLNLLQPPRTGKIRIVWEEIYGFERPRPAIYRRSKVDNQWKYDQVGATNLARRAKVAREFHDNHEVVRELLTHAQKLIQTRADLIASITNLRQGASARLRSVRPKAKRWQEHVMARLHDVEDGHYRRFDEVPDEGEEDEVSP